MRDDRWDFYKSMLILSVVTGHLITVFKCGSTVSSYFLVFIRTYDMPMFALISGYFLKQSCLRNTCMNNLLNKVSTILFPVIVWNVIFNLITGNSLFTVTRFWFLWSIFFVSVTMIVIDYLFKNFPTVKLFAFMTSIILFHTVIIDRWNIGFLLFYAVIGYYYLDILKKFKPKAYVCVGIFGLFAVMQIFWKADYNVWNAGCNLLIQENTLKIIFRAAIGIVGCVVMKNIFDLMFTKLSSSQHMIAVEAKKITVGIGKITLELYILQTYFIETCATIVVRKIVDHLDGYNPFLIFGVQFMSFVMAPLAGIVSLVILYYLVHVIRKTPYLGKFIFGCSWKSLAQLFDNRSFNEKV